MINRISKRLNLLRRDYWANIKIHQIMFKDKQRMECYKKAIENNLKKDAMVMDLGCGTGVLSFFAARKGCQKIYAIDKSSIINEAIEASRKNNLQQYIEFIKADIKKIKLATKIDMLIHDQIGSFIWNEDLVSKVARIRDNYLNKNGVILPSKIDIYFAPSSYRSELEKSIGFWSKKQFGFDFTNLSLKMFMQGYRRAIHPTIIYLKDSKTFLCQEKLVYSINLMKEHCLPLKIVANFRLKKNTRVSGVCVFFKIYFDRNTYLSTRPSKNNTHWGQIFLSAIEPKQITENSVLDFSLIPSIKPEDWKFKFTIQ